MHYNFLPRNSYNLSECFVQTVYVSRSGTCQGTFPKTNVDFSALFFSYFHPPGGMIFRYEWVAFFFCCCCCCTFLLRDLSSAHQTFFPRHNGVFFYLLSLTCHIRAHTQTQRTSHYFPAVCSEEEDVFLLLFQNECFFFWSICQRGCVDDVRRGVSS